MNYGLFDVFRPEYGWVERSDSKSSQRWSLVCVRLVQAQPELIGRTTVQGLEADICLEAARESEPIREVCEADQDHRLLRQVGVACGFVPLCLESLNSADAAQAAGQI